MTCEDALPQVTFRVRKHLFVLNFKWVCCSFYICVEVSRKSQNCAICRIIRKQLQVNKCICCSANVYSVTLGKLGKSQMPSLWNEKHLSSKSVTTFWQPFDLLQKYGLLQFHNLARLSLMWNIFHTVHWRFCEAGKLDLRKLVFDLVLPSSGLQCTSQMFLYSQKIGNHPPPASRARRRAVGQISKYSLVLG